MVDSLQLKQVTHLILISVSRMAHVYMFDLKFNMFGMLNFTGRPQTNKEQTHIQGQSTSPTCLTKSFNVNEFLIPAEDFKKLTLLSGKKRILLLLWIDNVVLI